MIVTTAIYLFRNDLGEINKIIPFEDINLFHFSYKLGREKINKSSIIIFVDDNNETKILKNRYGNCK